MKRNRYTLAAKRRSPAVIVTLGVMVSLLLCFGGFATKTLRAQEPAPAKQPTQQEQLQKWFEKRVDELGGRISYDSKRPNKPAVNLWLPEKQATDNDMTGIPQVFPEMLYIDLRKTRVTDLGVSRLQGLQKLSGLELSGTAVTDKSLSYIGNLPALKDLKLRETKITDEGLSHLGGRSWRILELGSNRITNQGMKLLANCESIENLDLPENPIDNEGLHYLAKIKGLQYLNLRGTKVSDIRVLESLLNLETLGISHTEVTDEALEHAKKLTKLSELYVNGTKITPEAVERFRKERPEVNCVDKPPITKQKH